MHGQYCCYGNGFALYMHVSILLGLCVCLSYLVEAHTGGAGDPGEGGVASSSSSSEQGRYTSAPQPGLDAHTHTYTGRVLTTIGDPSTVNTVD